MSGNTEPLIYTIGHSTHSESYFLELLQVYSISCLVDVRSIPASRFNPQFNQKRLSASLAAQGIAYRHEPEAFGARQTDPALLDKDGRVDFEAMRGSLPFRQGLKRLAQLQEQGATIALLCAESDPFQCHRFAMMAPALQEAGFSVRHILKDKSVIANTELEAQLLKAYAQSLPASSLFDTGSTAERLKKAYALRNYKMGYRPG